MKIISWNVNGIRAVHRKGFFVPFIEEYQPDILCLQETKAERHQSEIDLPDYEEYWNSATKKGYSGTAIFVKKSLGKPLSEIIGLPKKIAEKYQLLNDSYGDPNTEGRMVTLEFEKFYVISVYTPNSKPDLSRLSLRHTQWDPAFLAFCKELESKGNSPASGGKPVIFCGDLNVAHTEDDLANPDSNHFTHGFTDEEREGIDSIINAGFVDSFRLFTKGPKHYTWWSPFRGARDRNIGWRIDYIFVSTPLAKKVKESKILSEVFGSDHCPVMIEI